MEQKNVLSHYSLQHVESVLNKYLRRTCASLFDLIPSGAKKVGGRIITNFTNWFSSVVSDMETAKSPWEQHDKRFYNSLFSMAFDTIQEEIIAKGLLSEHLIELENLQDFMGMLTASPYLYMSALTELKTHLNKAEAGQIEVLQKTFLAQLAQQQSFLMQCLNADALYLLEDWCKNKISVETIINYLLFYQSALHPATHYTILCGLTHFLNSKKDNFLATVGEEEYIQFERFLNAKSQEFFRFRHLPVDTQEENSTLSSGTDHPAKSENLLTVNGFISVLSFMLQHPLQTLLLGLAAQVTAAAAFDPIRQASERNAFSQAKRITTNGIANEFPITTGAGNHTDLTMTTKGSGSEFVAAYAASDSSGFGIFLVGCDGNVQCSPPTQLNTITNSDQRAPTCIFLNNEYNCFWQSYSSSTLNDIMRIRINASTLQPIGPETTFSTTNTAFADQTLPCAAAGPSGSAVVGWMASNFDPGLGIALRFIQNGNPIGNDVVANKYVAQGQRYPAIACSSINCLIVWESDPGPGDPGSLHIRANFAYFNNTIGSQDFIVNSMEITGNQRFPKVASNGNGNSFLVVYESVGNIWGTIVTGPSQFNGTDFPIIQDVGLQTFPDVVYKKDNGSFLVTCMSDPTNSGIFEIVAREVMGDGTLVGPAPGTKINTLTNNQLNPRAISFRNGDWKDYVTGWETVVNGGNTQLELRVFNNSLPQPMTTAIPTTGIPITGIPTTGIPTTGTPPSNTMQTSQATTNSVVPTTARTDATVTSATTNPASTVSTQEIVTNSLTIASTTSMVLKSLSTDTQISTQQGNTDSSSKGQNQTGLVAGIATAVSVTSLIGIGVGAYGLKRYLDKKKNGQGTHRDASLVELSDRNRSSINSLNYSNRIEKQLTRVGNYTLLNKLNHDQVQKFFEISGIQFTIPTGKSAVKYNQLGQGQFGKLKLAEKSQTAEKLQTKELAAVKKIKGKSVNSSSQEVDIHSEIANEENIIKLYEAAHSKDSDGKPAIYMFMEFARYGNSLFLQECLPRLTDTNIREKILFDGLYQTLNGLSNMHKHNIFHCDMKPTNIVICINGIWKIIDFGNSVKSNSVMIQAGGDNRYYPPARYKKQKFNGRESDVWSTLLSFLEIPLGKFPLDNTDFRTRFATWDANYFLNKLNEIPELKHAKKGSFYAFIKEYLTLFLTSDKRELFEPNKLMAIIRQDYGHYLFKDSQTRAQVYTHLDFLSKSENNPISIPVNEVPRERDENYQSDYNTPQRRLTSTPMWSQRQSQSQSRQSQAELYGNEGVVYSPNYN